MSVQSVLERFAASKEPGAIVLQGKWGIGKTYFWRKKIIEPYLQKPWRKKYSYVSLFGVGSLAELKVAVYQATKEFDYDLRLKWWRFIHPRWWWWKAQNWLPAALASADIPYIREGVARSFHQLSFYFVKNRLICFDDIERRGDGLPLREVLGLVSQLVDERNCRVLVILNTDALATGDQPIWDDHKEKVFIGELTYAPSLREIIELGLEGAQGEIWYDVMRDALESLKVSNIRIVQRARRFINDVMAAVEGRQLRRETIESIAKVVPLLTFAHSGRGDGAPSLDFVMRTGPYAFALADEDVPPEEKRWMSLLSDYNVYLGDRLDEAICDMIQTGYPDNGRILAAVDAFENDAELQANKQAYKRAWRLYHDSLQDNAEEFAEAMERAWPRVSSHENVHNLQATARLFREVGRPEVATRIIQEWVDQRAGERIEELSRRELGTFGMPTDAELLAAIEAANAANVGPAMSLAEAIEAFGQDRVIKEAAVNAIAAASPRDIADFLIANPGPSLVATMRNVLALTDRAEKPNWQVARSNMEDAARDAASRCALNRDRIRNWFQIEPAEAPAQRGNNV